MGFMTSVHSGTHQYEINGVTYTVESKFQSGNNMGLSKRLERCITSDFAHLTDIFPADTMTDEYVCSAVGKED